MKSRGVSPAKRFFLPFTWVAVCAASALAADPDRSRYEPRPPEKPKLAPSPRPPAPKVRYTTDILGEEQIRVGLRIGPLVSGLASYTLTNGSTRNYSSTLEYAAGVGVEFVYSWVRLEFDGLWIQRQGLVSTEKAYGLSVPVLFKLPFPLGDDFEVELGGGPQFDYFVSGSDPVPRWLYGPVGAAGVLVKLGWITVGSEARYASIWNGLSDRVNGTEPRDLSLIFSCFWRIR